MRAGTKISRQPSPNSDYPMNIISPFLSWTRLDSYWDVVVAHLPLALITGIALLLPHLISSESLPLQKCTFLSLTGYPCPFCGFTRSFWAIAEGDWAFAVNNAPLACLAYIATALLFAWHITALLTLQRYLITKLLDISLMICHTTKQPFNVGSKLCYQFREKTNIFIRFQSLTLARAILTIL